MLQSGQFYISFETFADFQVQIISVGKEEKLSLVKAQSKKLMKLPSR